MEHKAQRTTHKMQDTIHKPQNKKRYAQKMKHKTHGVKKQTMKSKDVRCVAVSMCVAECCRVLQYG